MPTLRSSSRFSRGGGASFPACTESSFLGGASFPACTEASFLGGGVLPSQHALRHPSLGCFLFSMHWGTPPCGQTHACENITFVTSLRTVMILLMITRNFELWWCVFLTTVLSCVSRFFEHLLLLVKLFSSCSTREEHNFTTLRVTSSYVQNMWLSPKTVAC